MTSCSRHSGKSRLLLLCFVLLTFMTLIWLLTMHKDPLNMYLDETKAKSARGNSEFQELVNMTPGELRHWLEEPDSQSSGWASDSGETIGHESGRKIVSILERNPEGQPGRYTDAEIDHMRRVVSYCKRHLAQEESAKRNPHSRSYRSLKNWGHDALKE